VKYAEEKVIIVMFRQRTLRRFTMNANIRFTVPANGFVIDSINAANSGRWLPDEDKSYSEKDLRYFVLLNRLRKLIDKFMINLRPSYKDQPIDTQKISLYLIIAKTIKTSYLNTFDPMLSVKRRFDGRLKDEKTGLQDFTSIALFLDDVECLLRDLYGDIEDNALVGLKRTIAVLVEEFTQYACTDIWKEHHCAVVADLGLWGIGLPEGYGINGSMWRRGMLAIRDLGARVREVRANRNALGPYTIQSADWLAEEWPRLTEVVEEEQNDTPFINSKERPKNMDTDYNPATGRKWKRLADMMFDDIIAAKEQTK
jgi:hypothetical protein